MLDIFNSVNRHQFSRVTYSRWEQIKALMLNERVNKIKGYYRNAVIPVSPTHLFARIIATLNIAYHGAPEDIYDAIDMQAESIAKNFKCTSAGSLGRFHTGNFYGVDTLEQYFFYTDSTNVFDIISDWKNYASIKVMYHEKTDLSTLIPRVIHREGYSNEGNLAIFLVNLPALGMQYALYRKECAASNKDMSIVNFLAQIVLPNIIDSQLDWCVLNRLIAMVRDEPIVRSNTIHAVPFTVPNYASQIDHILMNVKKHIESTQLEFREVLYNIPMFYHDSALNLLELPIINHTVQASWLMILARLRVTNFLLDLRDAIALPDNQRYLNQLMLEIKISQFEHSILPRLPDRIQSPARQFMDKIKKVTL